MPGPFSRSQAAAAKRFPQAKGYVDWRKCLEQKDIEAIICCALDHTHTFLANWAMNRGQHVNCDKRCVAFRGSAI